MRITKKYRLGYEKPEYQRTLPVWLSCLDPVVLVPGSWDPWYRFPGNCVPGYWFPGNCVPGYWFPGKWVPGYWFPGKWVPGYWFPGKWVPGYWFAMGLGPLYFEADYNNWNYSNFAKIYILGSIGKYSL